MEKILKAAYEKNPIIIGDIEIPCAVLEDGTRVISYSATAKILGRTRGGRKKIIGGTKMPAFLIPKNLLPYVDTDLSAGLLNPIPYIPKNGGRALGLRAECLPNICNAWAKAYRAGVLTPAQNKAGIGQKSEILVKAFLGVSISSLVDEATEYQEIRKKDALNLLLEKIISKELLPWTKRFPDVFYDNLFRLRGIDLTAKTYQKPSWLGHITNRLVYDQISPEVRKELQRRTPKTEDGNGRKHRFHQLLTPDIGCPALEKQLVQVTTLMKASDTWDEFENHFSKVFPEKGKSIELEVI